jgi:hypothetical protein
MIASVTEQPFKELNSAIRLKDASAFAKAYASLTDACNSCHQALNHGVVKIRVPDRTSASDLNAVSLPRKLTLAMPEIQVTQSTRHSERQFNGSR